MDVKIETLEDVKGFAMEKSAGEWWVGTAEGGGEGFTNEIILKYFL